MATEVAANELAYKIAKLVEERGWNQEDFARFTNLNRHTIRQILHAEPTRRLRNATVSSCAEALGLTVNELRTQPLERLLPRMHGKPAADDEALKLLRN
jgi:transcriptional regulator with XRE-family HTH domain